MPLAEPLVLLVLWTSTSVNWRLIASNCTVSPGVPVPSLLAFVEVLGAVLVPDVDEFCESAAEAVEAELSADVGVAVELAAAASCALGDVVVVSCPASCASASMSPTIALNAVGLIPSISCAIWSNTPISCWFRPSAASALFKPCSAFELSEFDPVDEAESFVLALVGALEVGELADESVLDGCVEVVGPELAADESAGEFVDDEAPVALLVLEGELDVDCAVAVDGSLCVAAEEAPDVVAVEDAEFAAGCWPTTNVPENANTTSLIETDSPLPPSP